MTSNLSTFAKSLGVAVFVSFAVSAQARADSLHGFCGTSYGTSSCTDNGVITPFAPGALNGGFGFAADPNSLTGTDWLIAILVPSSLIGASSENFTLSDTAGAGNVAHSNVSAGGKGLFSSGDLASFLGLSGSSPNNPFGAFTVMNDSAVTGFYVYLADLGATTLPNQAGSTAPFAPILTLGGSSLLPGMEITSFLKGAGDTNHPTVATAPSSVLLETNGPPPTPVPEPSSLLLCGSGLVGLVKGWAARRRQRS